MKVADRINFVIQRDGETGESKLISIPNKSLLDTAVEIHRSLFNCLNKKGWPIGQPSEISFGDFQLEIPTLFCLVLDYCSEECQADKNVLANGSL